MTKVRRENSESIEYICPECGETFEEGAKDCTSCGLEFNWSEELEYLCPECGTIVDPDSSRCPGCNAMFSREENGDITIEYEPDAEPPSVEDLLDAAIDEVMIRPSPSPVEASPDDDLDFEDLEMERTGGEAEAEQEVEATLRTSEKAAADGDLPEYKGLYPGGFTRVGFVFAILALLALAFTVVMARYDTWIQGAAEESMGDDQRMVFFAGLAAFAVCIVIAVADLLRSPKRSRKGTD